MASSPRRTGRRLGGKQRVITDVSVWRRHVPRYEISKTLQVRGYEWVRRVASAAAARQRDSAPYDLPSLPLA